MSPNEVHNNALNVLLTNTIAGYDIANDVHGISHLRRVCIAQAEMCEQALENIDERANEPNHDDGSTEEDDE